MPSSRSLGVATALVACAAIASFASAAPASGSGEPVPSPAVQARIAQFNQGLATFRAGSEQLVVELDQIPVYAPKSEASRACYDQLLPTVDPVMAEARATSEFLKTGHECTIESGDGCWMPVFDQLDAKLADVTSRVGELRASFEACRKLGT